MSPDRGAIRAPPPMVSLFERMDERLEERPDDKAVERCPRGPLDAPVNDVPALCAKAIGAESKSAEAASSIFMFFILHQRNPSKLVATN